ncbi:LysE family translocator [Desulfohalobiaceae bacterium Ax17]|uniref:LysE family translocator n=1 Tax=Desulfovulcanus ferrireducens TaxID=2831190 RepID=UPI00207BB178|nr:LysE family translocator [Desulfovulcanus ferrireducens]MBT8763130.1 LysE family translocator [Desulfovulcanus ferrireducens]
MTIYSAIGFSVAMLILAASPGPGVFATVARALASGFRPALIVICGIVLGDVIFLLFATFGLSIVAQALGNLFFIVKICGSIYLIFLGFKIWFKEPAHAVSEYEWCTKARWGNFISGLLITLSNPKVIFFYCGFLPTFLDLSVLTLSDLVVVVGIVIIVLASVLATYAFLASCTRQMFTKQKAARRLNRTAGGLMVASGVAIVTRS